MNERSKNLLSALAVVTATAALVACGGGLEQQSALDTPQAHYRAGMMRLQQGNLPEARAEFEYAIGLDDDYAPGYEGLGLVELELGQGREAERQFRQAISKDRDYAPAYVGLGLALKMQGNQRGAIRAFEDAIERAPKLAPAYDHLAQVYIDQRDFAQATQAYRRGLTELPDDMVLNEGWQRTSEMERATMGVPPEYMEIALSPELTRAELAVLLQGEIPLRPVFIGKVPPTDRRFAPPGQEYAIPEQPDRITKPIDIESTYWARQAIQECIDVGAMDPFPDGSFRPDQVVTRQEMALLIQRVLVEAWEDPSLKTQFFGSTSPFADVPNTHFAFNAVALATTRGIMQGRADGTFFLEGTLPGHEAILIMRNLKEALQP